MVAKAGHNYSKSKQRKPVQSSTEIKSPDAAGFPMSLDQDFIFILTEQLHCFLFGFNGLS